MELYRTLYCYHVDASCLYTKKVDITTFPLDPETISEINKLNHILYQNKTEVVGGVIIHETFKGSYYIYKRIKEEEIDPFIKEQLLYFAQTLPNECLNKLEKDLSKSNRNITIQNIIFIFALILGVIDIIWYCVSINNPDFWLLFKIPLMIILISLAGRFSFIGRNSPWFMIRNMKKGTISHKRILRL